MSTLVIANGHDALCLASFQALPDDEHSLYRGSIGPVPLPHDSLDWVTRIATVLVNSFALAGIFGVDWIVDRARQHFVLEVNPRWPATAELCIRSCGYPLVQWHVNAADPATGTLPQLPACTSGRRFVKRIHYAPSERVFRMRDQSELRAAIAAATQPYVQQFGAINTLKATLHDLPNEGATIPAGEPVCTLIAPLGEHGHAGT